MNKDDLCDHVTASIRHALNGQSRVKPEVLQIKGFATETQRHLVNNLVQIPEIGRPVRYLEVGLYCGATFCAALSGNKDLIAVGYENFSQDFGAKNVEQTLWHNVKIHRPDLNLEIFDKDCFDELPSLEAPFDVFYYDGHHDAQFQRKALPHFLPILADTFIYMVDDVDWTEVGKAVKQGIEDCGDKIQVHRRWELTDHRPDGPRWHNGVHLYVISKA